jgi:hypothetical protein
VAVGLLDAFGQLEQFAEEAGAAQQRIRDLFADRDLLDDVGHRDAEQDIHQRHDADREGDLGQVALARAQALGQQLHQAAAGRGQHQQRGLVVAACARLGVQHDLQPALQLAPAQHEQGLGHRIDALARPDRRRVHQAQQVHRHRHVALHGAFDVGVVDVRGHQLHQLEHGGLRRRELASAQHRRAGEIIALEVVDAEVEAGLVFVAGLDLVRHHGLVHAVQARHQGRQRRLRRGAQVELDKARQRQQLLQARLVAPTRRSAIRGDAAADAVQRELETVAGQLGHARQHCVAWRHRGGQFEHGALARQEGVDVAAEHVGVDVQEAVGVADRARQAELGGVGDDGGGGVQARCGCGCCCPCRCSPGRAAYCGTAARSRTAPGCGPARAGGPGRNHAPAGDGRHDPGLGIGHLGLVGGLYTGLLYRIPSA